MKKQLSFRIERRGPIIRRRFVDSQSNAETMSIRSAGNQRLSFGTPLKYTFVARFLLSIGTTCGVTVRGKRCCDVKRSKNKICRVAARTAATL
jgi:hypothetical protein